jgi:23S rRNA pseudouridine2605 synthase
MFEALGYQVTKLLRVRIGNLWLGDLEPAQYAILNKKEIAMLLDEKA